MSNEVIAHVRVCDRNFFVYISLCHESNNLHILKYDDVSCEYEVFPMSGTNSEIPTITVWIQKPIKRVRFWIRSPPKLKSQSFSTVTEQSGTVAVHPQNSCSNLLLYYVYIIREPGGIVNRFLRLKAEVGRTNYVEGPASSAFRSLLLFPVPSLCVYDTHKWSPCQLLTVVLSYVICALVILVFKSNGWQVEWNLYNSGIG